METFVKLYEKKNPKKIQKTKTKEKTENSKPLFSFAEVRCKMFRVTPVPSYYFEISAIDFVL